MEVEESGANKGVNVMVEMKSSQDEGNEKDRNKGASAVGRSFGASVTSSSKSVVEKMKQAQPKSTRKENGTDDMEDQDKDAAESNTSKKSDTTVKYLVKHNAKESSPELAVYDDSGSDKKENQQKLESEAIEENGDVTTRLDKRDSREQSPSSRGDREENEDETITLTKTRWNEFSKTVNVIMKQARKRTKEDRNVNDEQKIQTIDEAFDIVQQFLRQEQFCKDFDKFDDVHYSVPSLSTIENEYEMIYDDFSSINSKLIDGELKNLLLKQSNNSNDVDLIYSKIIRRRNICSLFPFKHFIPSWDKYGENYMSLINQCNKNNNDKVKMFCILYNCMVSTIVTGDVYDCGGLDRYIHNYESKNENGNDLVNLCKWYILLEMAKTGVFGIDKELIQPGKYCYDEDVQNSKVISLIIEYVFENDLKSFERLIEYCIQDIGYSDNIETLKNVYDRNNKRSEGHYGIAFYILNRLTYVIFHDLVEKNAMLFPKLQKFYQFFVNFSIYCHCYPHNGVENAFDDRDDKKFQEYAVAKKNNTLFPNTDMYTIVFYLEEYHKSRNAQRGGDALNHYQYYHGRKWDGTLLHCAVFYNFFSYVELLLADGFDPNMSNRHGSKSTPTSIAKENNLELILSLLKGNSEKNEDKKQDEENKEGKDGEMGDSLVKMRYESFTNSYMSCIYYLYCLGFYDIFSKHDEQLNMKLSQKEMKDDFNQFKYDLTKVPGLNINDINIDNKSRNNFMADTLRCVELMLKLKMPLSLDLVLLACIYANYGNNDQFLVVLESTILECLNIGHKENDYKQFRNFEWFKQYILNSNLWIVKISSQIKNDDDGVIADENQDDSKDPDGPKILYDKIVEGINLLSMQQREFIWNNVETIRQDDKTNIVFEKLCQIRINEDEKKNDNENKNENKRKKPLRQDAINNGIRADVTQSQILLHNLGVGTDGHSSFDLEYESNTKLYLTKCLAFAHKHNKRLQSEMRTYFHRMEYASLIKCEYQSAPVKLTDRCVVKATSDYGKAKYPSCARILDYMRFSVTFHHVNDLLNGLNKFILDIEKGNVIQCILPNSILRIKNGFNSIVKKWENVNDASYVDIKLNIVYVDTNTNTQMIIEAQFLLSFLLEAKKMIHKYYEILRQSKWINKVKNQVYSIDNNYEKYKKKIVVFIQDHDSDALIKQVFWKPHVVLSMVVQGRYGIYPLFAEISREFGMHNGRLILFFLSCLLFYSFDMLQQPNDEKNKFLTRYFGETMCHTLDSDTFYHIPISSIVKSSSQSTIVNLILRTEYLRGLALGDPHNVCVFLCVLY